MCSVINQFKRNNANRLVQLIAGRGDFRATPTVIRRSGTGPAKCRAGRVPSLPISAIHPPRQPAIPDEGRSPEYMRYLTFLFFIGFLCLPCAIGNPIVVDSERRPATMTSEQVSVEVGKGHSTVSGDYGFQQRPDDWAGIKPLYVLIYVPVILSEQWAKKYESTFGPPVVSTAGRDFPAGIRNDLALGDSPESVELPKGWFLQIYEVKIPLRYVSENFDIKLKYIQPNFDGDRVGYVPFLPPDNPTNSRITFRAPADASIRRVGFLSSLSPKKSTIDFTPKDRRLVSVGLQQK